ncbi:ribonuclease P protein component, partial [Bacteroides sp. OttesenSCG-928-J23]|nr:ribonuclease P protein component [Bacteroides sp. OttesenSCG-928-J23]
MYKYTLDKAERICSKILIEKMFSGGAKSFSIYPLRVVYIYTEKKETASAAILTSVSKK